MILQSNDDEFYAKHEYSGKSWRYSNKYEVYIGYEHWKSRSIGAYNLKITKVENSGDYNKDVDEVDGLFEEVWFLFGLISNSSQKLSS